MHIIIGKFAVDAIWVNTQIYKYLLASGLSKITWTKSQSALWLEVHMEDEPRRRFTG